MDFHAVFLRSAGGTIAQSKRKDTDMSEEITFTSEPEAVDAAKTENQPAGGSPKEHLYTDAYVKARIDKQRGKYEEQLADRDARIAELEKQSSEAQEKAQALEHEKELATWAAEAAKATGVDASIIKGATAEEMMAHAEAIKASFAAKSAYPVIPDSGKPAQKTLSKEDIAAIPNDKERLAAIKANIALWED